MSFVNTGVIKIAKGECAILAIGGLETVLSAQQEQEYRKSGDGTPFAVDGGCDPFVHLNG